MWTYQRREILSLYSSTNSDKSLISLKIIPSLLKNEIFCSVPFYSIRANKEQSSVDIGKQWQKVSAVCNLLLLSSCWAFVSILDWIHWSDELEKRENC